MINEYFSPSFRNSTTNFKPDYCSSHEHAQQNHKTTIESTDDDMYDQEQYLLKKSMNKMDEFFSQQKKHPMSAREIQDKKLLYEARLSVEQALSKITTKLLNQLKLMIKPELKIINSFRVLIILYQGTDTWIQQDFRVYFLPFIYQKQCHWFKLLELLKSPQKLIITLRQFNQFIEEEKMTENQIIMASQVKDRSRTKHEKKSLVSEYCQIIDDTSKALETYIYLLQRLKLEREGQQYQLMNEDSVQRLEIIQEQPSRCCLDSSIKSQDHLHNNNSFQLANELDESGVCVNKDARSVSTNAQSIPAKFYSSQSQQKIPDRYLYSQQPSQSRIPIKHDHKAKTSEIYNKMLEAHESNKLKLRQMMQENKQIISQLQIQESQLKQKIDKEKAQELIRVRMITPIVGSSRGSKEKYTFNKISQLQEERDPNWKFIKNQMNDKQKNMDRQSALRPKSHNQSYTT